MNKKAVLTFLISMVVMASVILLVIRGVQSGFFGSLVAKKPAETSAEITVISSSETAETTPEVINFLTEAEAMNYVSNYASENGIDISLYPQPLYGLLVRNPDALEFVLNYPLHVIQPTAVPVETTSIETDEDGETVETSATSATTEEETTASVTEIVSLEGDVSTARITPLYTWDSRWGYTEYGNGRFCFTGSAPTCVSIVAMYLLRNAAFSPQWIAAYSMNNGYCNENCDGSHESALVADGGFGLGINVTQIPASDEDRIKRNLDVPNPIICDVGDHYIILLSYEEEEFTVIDPTSEYDTNRTWSWTELSQRLEGLWVYRVL